MLPWVTPGKSVTELRRPDCTYLYTSPRRNLVRRLRRGVGEEAVWTPHQKESKQRVEHRDGERPESDVTDLLLVRTPCCKQGSSKVNSLSASQIRSSFKHENSLPCSQKPSNSTYPEPNESSPFRTLYLSNVHLQLTSLPSGRWPHVVCVCMCPSTFNFSTTQQTFTRFVTKIVLLEGPQTL